jgi:anti-sigma B factor antagonist
MTFGVEREPGWALLQLSGDIDAVWVHREQEAITQFFEDCPALVVVDLEQVTFMDSSGLGLLARCVKTCNDNQGEVVVAHAAKGVRKAIEVVGLDQFVTLVDESAEQVIRDMPTVDDVL